MTKTKIDSALKKNLLVFLQKQKSTDLLSSYLFYIEKKFHLKPVLFPKEKIIYQSLDSLVQKLEKEGKLCREVEIKIQFGQQSVNEKTTKIYICPFTGKVFGDNTHPNPQDAIYDWVSRCPENTERVGGLKAKRFLVSEDPEIIKNYYTKRKDPITKVVFSSVISGKLFNSKEAVVEDFIENHVKKLSLQEVQNQNRFQIEETFLSFIREQVTETKISRFVEELSQEEDFEPYLQKWLK